MSWYRRHAVTGWQAHPIHLGPNEVHGAVCSLDHWTLTLHPPLSHLQLETPVMHTLAKAVNTLRLGCAKCLCCN